MSILDDTAPPIGYVGGSLVGQVRVGTICNLRVCVHREFWFARDIVSNEWSAFVELPERDSGGDDAAGVGSILITDPAVNTFPPPTPPITYVGGLFTGQVRVGTICNLRVCIHREFWFARDIVSDEWSAYVELPERDSGSAAAAGMGAILITDPTVNAFLERLV